MRTLNIALLIIVFTLASCQESQFGQVKEVPTNESLGAPTGDVIGGGSGDSSGDGPGDSGGGGSDPTLLAKSENFVQNINNTKVDILWNIDNSGSMGNEQQALANNFDIFINSFIAKNVDFKMAITTTDANAQHNGNIIGNSDQILNKAAADLDENQFINDFQNLINVGTNGSGYEKGLATTNSFLDKNGASFLRSDALLVVVMVSDENDVSDGSVASHVAGIKAHKANAKFYSIIDTQGVQIIQGNSTLGQRYIEASQQLGASVADINASFYQTLQDIGESIVSLTESFVLAESPSSADSIKVYVNGALQPLEAYSFEAVSRIVKFNAGYVPAQGATIKIDYSVVK